MQTFFFLFLYLFLWEGVVVLFGDGDVGLEVWFGLRKEGGDWWKKELVVYIFDDFMFENRRKKIFEGGISG